MYEHYYGFAEKPFNLTPDPKYLYRSQSHANAFDLLQYAIRRREGFVVVTGDIGTGKTTLCRALLERIDRTTFTALVLNPFLSEEDLLKRILQDFGVISRDDIKAGRLTTVTKQELIETLYDFLLGLIPLKASAVLIIDEAQNLPLKVLEQIRILSNLETDKEKLLQIILVGQLNLHTLLRSPELRQLDQRISIRYELKPLDRETVAAYVAHRLTIAGGSSAVSFTAKALGLVHRLSGGIPRLINLICDRALLAGFSVHSTRITPDMVRHAAESLDVQPSLGARFRWLTPRTALAAGAAATVLSATLAVAATTLVYQRLGVDTVQAESVAPEPIVSAPVVVEVAADEPGRPMPDEATSTILVGAYRSDEGSQPGIRALTAWIEAAGFPVYYDHMDLGPEGRWLRLLAGAYTEESAASADAARLNALAPGLGAAVIARPAAAGSDR